MTYFKRRSLGGILFLAPYAISFSLFVLVPLGVAGFLAFMQFDLTSEDSIRFVGLQNFKDVFADQYFWAALHATLRYAILMVPSLLVISLGIALGLNAMTRGRNTIRALIYLPALLNVAVTAILWRWFYEGEFGLFNFFLKHIGMQPMPFLGDKAWAMPSIVVMSLWWSAGGTAIVLLAALQQIPRHIIEAGALDGAGRWQMFQQIVLPLLRPVLLFVVITNTIGAFQVFGQAFLLTSGNPENSTRGLVQLIYETAFNNYRLGYGAALSWVLFGIVFVFVIAQYAVLKRSTV